MEEEKQTGRIEKLTRRYQRVTPYINSMCEEFYYSDINPQKVRRVLYPIQAGITHPSGEYFCRVPKSDSIAPFQYVLEYVVSGRGYIDAGGKKYEVRAGDTYLINRVTSVTCWYADADDPYEKKWVNVAGRFLDGLIYTYGMTAPVYSAPINTEAELDEIHRILLEYDYRNPQPDDLALMQVILTIFDRLRNAVRQKAEKPERVVFQQILEYISANLLFEQLGPSVICYSFYISHRTLIRMFSKNLGISPVRYITLQRVEYAKQLLGTTNYSVEKISDMLHFSSVQHFRRVFSELCGMPPTAWRKKAGKDAASSGGSSK